jgi:hypothetical protein
MAELHKFQDDAKDKKKAVGPLVARHMDENWKTVRLELSDSLKSFLQRIETPGVPDRLDFVTQPPSAAAIAVFQAGRFLEWRTISVCPS